MVKIVLKDKNINFDNLLLENGLKGSPSCVVQPNEVLTEGQHLPPVGLVDPLLNSFLDTGLEFVTAEEIKSDQEIEHV